KTSFFMMRSPDRLWKWRRSSRPWFPACVVEGEKVFRHGSSRAACRLRERAEEIGRIGKSPNFAVSWTPSPRRQPLRCDEDQEPDQPAHQRAIDADELQVLADLQLEPVDQRGAVPVLHHL